MSINRLFFNINNKIIVIYLANYIKYFNICIMKQFSVTCEVTENLKLLPTPFHKSKGVLFSSL